jgi:hypothetical protein
MRFLIREEAIYFIPFLDDPVIESNFIVQEYPKINVEIVFGYFCGKTNNKREKGRFVEIS